METNLLGQPVGRPVSDWTPRPLPTASVLSGRYCRLERLSPERHAEELFAADRQDRSGVSWTYLPYGPFADLGSYRRWAEQVSRSDDPLFYAVIDTDSAAGSVAERAVGVLSYLRVQPEAGSIEVGHVHYSPLLQRHRAATETQLLFMRHAFAELGYRRYEWKCDALNAASRAAAERLGFCYEGTFRQAAVVKGRNRDTAWYSIIDTEWPVIHDRLSTWLAPENFDDHAHQRTSLRASKSPR
jgi:RimJ/RimL family protein N-acetyltransferase